MKPFKDFWRGNGFFKTWKLPRHTLLLAFRWAWRFYKVNPPAKPGYTRYYFGPVEIEVSPR